MRIHILTILLQCQSIENLDEITVIGALLYRGADPAGKQLSGLFTGSPVFRKLIDANDVDVRKLLDRLMVALKYVYQSWLNSSLLTTLFRTPELIKLGFNIPTFDTDAAAVKPRAGEAPRDRDRRVLGMHMREELC